MKIFSILIMAVIFSSCSSSTQKQKDLIRSILGDHVILIRDCYKKDIKSPRKKYETSFSIEYSSNLKGRVMNHKYVNDKDVPKSLKTCIDNTVKTILFPKGKIFEISQPYNLYKTRK